MTTRHSLSNEVCLGYLSALQASAIQIRQRKPLAATRRRTFPRGELRLEHIKRLAPLPENRLTTESSKAFGNPIGAKASPGGRSVTGSISLPIHFITSDTTFRRPSQFRQPHSCSHVFSGRALDRWDDKILLASPALAFVQEASRRSLIDALCLGYEICGTYQQAVTPGAIVYQTHPLSSTRDIRRLLKNNPSLPGAVQARKALRYLADKSASPRETQTALLLGLPPYYGGYGLGIPAMNHEIHCTAKAAAIAGRKTLRCDLFWPAANLAVEYQSREFHAGEQQRVRDSRRTNALQSMGIQVVAITNDELDCIDAVDVIAATIRKAQKRRFRTSVGDYHRRKIKLRQQLGLPLRPRDAY